MSRWMLDSGTERRGLSYKNKEICIFYTFQMKIEFSMFGKSDILYVAGGETVYD